VIRRLPSACAREGPPHTPAPSWFFLREPQPRRKGREADILLHVVQRGLRGELGPRLHTGCCSARTSSLFPRRADGANGCDRPHQPVCPLGRVNATCTPGQITALTTCPRAAMAQPGRGTVSCIPECVLREPARALPGRRRRRVAVRRSVRSVTGRQCWPGPAGLRAVRVWWPTGACILSPVVAPVAHRV